MARAQDTKSGRASTPTPPPPAPAPFDAPSASRRLFDVLAFAGICAIAFALRYAYLLQARAVPTFDAWLMDGRSYGVWADKIAAGDWLGDQVFYQAPLYPYFLAVTKLAVGSDLWSIRLVQIGLGSLACGLLYCAAKRFHSRAAGIVAGLALALYPSAIFFDALIQKANLGLLWTTALLCALGGVTRAPTTWRFGAVGVTLGLLMLTREETILLVPALALWFLFTLRDRAWPVRARWIGAWTLGLALVLLPVGFRNQAVGGEFVLTTSQAGSNFYIGNNPKASGSYTPLREGRSDTMYERTDAIELAEAESGRKLSPSEVSRFWFAKSFAWIRAEPGAWVSLLWTKVRLLVNTHEMPDTEDVYFFECYSSILRVLGAVWNYGVLVPLALFGIVIAWRKRHDFAVLYPTLLVFCAGPVIFYVFARYRYPVVPVLIVFASIGAVEASLALRAREHARVVLPTILALVVVPLATVPLYPKDFHLAESAQNSAVALAQLGDDQGSIPLFELSIALKPRAQAYGNMGVSLARLGRLPEAAKAFERALELGPGDPRAELRLGATLLDLGRLAEALAHLRRATELAPTNAEALGYLARALIRDKRHAEAIVALERVLAIAPHDVPASQSLAWILATAPDAKLRDGTRAARIVEPLLARTPDDIALLDTLAAAYAESGRFTEARARVQRAIEVAAQRGRTEAVGPLRARLLVYERGEAFHQPQ